MMDTHDSKQSNPLHPATLANLRDAANAAEAASLLSGACGHLSEQGGASAEQCAEIANICAEICEQRGPHGDLMARIEALFGDEPEPGGGEPVGIVVGPCCQHEAEIKQLKASHDIATGRLTEALLKLGARDRTIAEQQALLEKTRAERDSLNLFLKDKQAECEELREVIEGVRAVSLAKSA